VAAAALLLVQSWRVSEVLGLASAEVDLDEADATVRRVSVHAAGVGMMLGPPRTKGAKGRHHLTRVVVELLRAYRYSRDERCCRVLRHGHIVKAAPDGAGGRRVGRPSARLEVMPERLTNDLGDGDSVGLRPSSEPLLELGIEPDGLDRRGCRTEPRAAALAPASEDLVDVVAVGSLFGHRFDQLVVDRLA
jgi:hypothetical protein